MAELVTILGYVIVIILQVATILVGIIAILFGLWYVLDRLYLIPFSWTPMGLEDRRNDWLHEYNRNRPYD